MKVFYLFFSVLLTTSKLNIPKSLFVKDTGLIKKGVKIKLTLFTRTPKEIDGCACYFYLTLNQQKEEKYIFVNDFAQFAFVSINGNIQKFKLKEHNMNSKNYLYHNGIYNLKVVIIKSKTGKAEESIEQGTITLLKGESILDEKNFIGTCGC